MPALRIALLGAGIFALEAHLPAIAALGSDIVHLSAVYSRSHKSSKALADAARSLLGTSQVPDIYSDDAPDSEHQLSALLARSDIAAVIIALPITLQPSIVLKSLAAGKHVLSEKPVGPDVASGLKLIKEYESTYKPKGLLWRVAENYEAEPGYRAAAQAIKDGKIGDVRFFRLTAVNYVGKDSKWYKTPWRTIPDYQGGFLLDGGVHSAALLRLLLAANPSAKTPHDISQLTAYASLSRDHLAPQDTITALLSTAPAGIDAPPKGASAATPTPHLHGVLELSFAAPGPSRASGTGNGTVVTGSTGWLDIRGAKSARGENVVRVEIARRVSSEEDEAAGGGVREETSVVEERVRGVELELASFVYAVQEARQDLVALKAEGLREAIKEPIGEPREALKDVAVIEAALKSEGTAVDLVELVNGA